MYINFSLGLFSFFFFLRFCFLAITYLAGLDGGAGVLVICDILRFFGYQLKFQPISQLSANFAIIFTIILKNKLLRR